jgi:hypothetical protein
LDMRRSANERRRGEYILPSYQRKAELLAP